jgi:hypothetical protein
MVSNPYESFAEDVVSSGMQTHPKSKARPKNIVGHATTKAGAAVAIGLTLAATLEGSNIRPEHVFVDSSLNIHVGPQTGSLWLGWLLCLLFALFAAYVIHYVLLLAPVHQYDHHYIRNRVRTIAVNSADVILRFLGLPTYEQIRALERDIANSEVRLRMAADMIKDCADIAHDSWCSPVVSIRDAEVMISVAPFNTSQNCNQCIITGHQHEIQ